MATAALVIGLISGAFLAGTQGVAFITAVKSLHHHTTAVVYKHVVKPTARTLKKVVTE